MLTVNYAVQLRVRSDVSTSGHLRLPRWFMSVQHGKVQTAIHKICIGFPLELIARFLPADMIPVLLRMCIRI